jgi:hypothetical protein
MLSSVSRLKNARLTLKPGMPGYSTSTDLLGTKRDFKEISDIFLLFVNTMG